jgi:hypothetical protein
VSDKKVTKHTVNFIPTGKSYAGVLVCYGGGAEVTGKEKSVDAMLAFAAERRRGRSSVIRTTSPSSSSRRPRSSAPPSSSESASPRNRRRGSANPENFD